MPRCEICFYVLFECTPLCTDLRIIWTDNFCLTSSYSSQFLYSSNYQVSSCRCHGNHSPPKREEAIVKIVQIVVHIYQSAKRVKQYSRSAGVGGGGGILIIKWKEGLVDLTFSINLSRVQIWKIHTYKCLKYIKTIRQGKTQHQSS